MKILYTCLAVLISCVCFGQDIILSGTTGPKEFGEREEFVQEFTLKNSGIVSTAGFFSDFFFSLDNTLDGSDYRIGIRYLSGLAAGASQTIGTTSSYLDVAPGTYYLIVKLDSYGAVTETDESNNIIVVPGYLVTAPDYDLQLISFTSDKSSYPTGDRALVSCLVANTGSTNLGGPVGVEFYLSDNSSWDAADHGLQFEVEHFGGPDEQNYSDVVLVVPQKPAGAYYIIARVDTNEDIPETNEGNNIAAIPVTITEGDLDLELGDLFVDSSYPTSICYLTLRNNGTTPLYLEGYQLTDVATPIGGGSYYADVSFHTSDFPVYLLPGETSYVSGYVYVSPDTPGGTMFNLSILSYLDGDVETFNNQTSTVFVVASPPVRSARLVSLTPIGLYDDTDLTVEFDLGVNNNGEDSYFLQYYTLSIFDVALNEVYSKNFSVVFGPPGESRIERISATFTDPLPVGSYTVRVQCQWSCETSPSSISSTLTINPVQYSLTGTVQGEDGVLLTDGKLFLYQKGDDGVLRFVQKATPVGASFSFGIDSHEHTLYYVPDPVSESNYVPTVYGKTIALTPTSLFTLTGDQNLVFEIIKVQPMASGSGIINGYVTSPAEPQVAQMRVATSFSSTVQTSESSFPIMLLSSSGDVVRLTYTDENGYYEFKNLPREEFGVFISRELDQTVMNEPYRVDITTRNKTVNVDLSSEGVAPEESILMFSQSIDFADITDAIYGAAPLALTATSDSGLPVSFESSDPAVAEIVSSTLVIRKPGTVTVTAKQTGDNFFDPATSAQTISILKAAQVLTMEDLPEATFGDSPVQLSASSSTGLPLTFESNDPTIAEIDGTTILVKKPGSVSIIARQVGNTYYEEASVSKPFTVRKAARTITFLDLPQKYFGDAAFVPQISGSTGTVTLHSSNPNVAAVENEKIVIKRPGTVTITAELPEDEFYLPASDAQLLTIGKGTSDLTFPALPEKSFGDSEFDAGVTSTSSRPIVLTSSDQSIARLANGKISILKPGIVTLTATQNADDFFHESSVSRTLVIRKAMQLISLPEVPGKTFGDPAFEIAATATSKLPLHVSISDESVVTFDFNKYVIRGAGTVVITFEQSGDEFFEAAEPIQKSLTVVKAPQTIVFSELSPKQVSDAAFSLLAT
ncbi:MAG TPA: CARDB domain-containing protein, partial [Chryseosolibacter sp.]